jgi:hypothetical protein
MRRHVDPESLLLMGYSKQVIQEVVRAQARGLFDMEPSPELVDRTVDTCIKKGLIPSAYGDKSLLKKLFSVIFKGQ